jgi:hypothetical protein
MGKRRVWNASMTLSAFTRSGRGISTLSAALVLFMAMNGPTRAQEATPPAPTVQAQTLRALDLWSAPGGATDLSPDLWQGASGETAKRVLAGIDSKPLTPAFAALARRALATGATAPDGLGSDLDAAAARAHALIKLGGAGAAAAILGRTSQIETNESLARAKAESSLLTGQDDEACETGKGLQTGRDGLWWLQLRAYCHLRAGETAAAQVTLDLWRQNGGKAEGFERLASAAATGAEPGPAALDGSLDYALSRYLKLEIEPNAANASPAVLGVLNAPEPAAAIDEDALAKLLETLVDQAAKGDAKTKLKSQAGALLLASLGAPLSPGGWDALSRFATPSGKAGPARILALDRAASQKRVGATVLMALEIAQLQAMPATADRAATVRALARAGLMTEARAIAVEGLVGLGLWPPT